MVLASKKKRRCLSGHVGPRFFFLLCYSYYYMVMTPHIHTHTTRRNSPKNWATNQCSKRENCVPFLKSWSLTHWQADYSLCFLSLPCHHHYLWMGSNESLGRHYNMSAKLWNTVLFLAISVIRYLRLEWLLLLFKRRNIFIKDWGRPQSKGNGQSLSSPLKDDSDQIKA